MLLPPSTVNLSNHLPGGEVKKAAKAVAVHSGRSVEISLATLTTSYLIWNLLRYERVDLLPTCHSSLKWRAAFKCYGAMWHVLEERWTIKVIDQSQRETVALLRAAGVQVGQLACLFVIRTYFENLSAT